MTGIQSVAGIKNCDEKVLQSTTSITNFVNYYKERRNTSLYLKGKDTSLKA